MANLEPMPISSLPELDKLQDGDEAVIYRPSTGKAYQAPDLLQDLEEKIQENTDLIDSLNGMISYYANTFDSLLAKVQDMNNRACIMFYVPASVAETLTNGNLSVSARGVLAKMDTSGTYFDFILYAVQSGRGVLFSGRYNDGLTSCDKFTGTSVL